MHMIQAPDSSVLGIRRSRKATKHIRDIIAVQK